MIKKFPTQKDVEKKPGWKDIPTGGTITSPCSSMLNKTGSWRSFKPKWNSEKCKHCMICVVYCPEKAIPTKDGKRLETNFDYCKGCGLCSKECVFKAIEMVEEK